MKLAGVLVLLGLAAMNKFRVTPALDKGQLGARRTLGRNVNAEILVGIVVIALAAGFRLTVPPRSLDVATPITVDLIGSQLSGQLTLSPARAGQNAARIDLRSPDGSHVMPKEVEIALTAPELKVEAIRVPAEMNEDHSWITGPFFLPAAGTWDVVVEVLVTDFSKDMLSSQVPIVD